MDSGEEAICGEYESSLEDLTFNSKPLINVLTMLAEENSQFASSITKLIANRIYQVCISTIYLLSRCYIINQSKGCTIHSIIYNFVSSRC